MGCHQSCVIVATLHLRWDKFLPVRDRKSDFSWIWISHFSENSENWDFSRQKKWESIRSVWLTNGNWALSSRLKLSTKQTRARLSMVVSQSFYAATQLRKSWKRVHSAKHFIFASFSVLSMVPYSSIRCYFVVPSTELTNTRNFRVCPIWTCSCLFAMFFSIHSVPKIHGFTACIHAHEDTPKHCANQKKKMDEFLVLKKHPFEASAVFNTITTTEYWKRTGHTASYFMTTTPV